MTGFCQRAKLHYWSLSYRY
uniref:Uncharacterized protein n=1 Tax=Anguilla anguilla TaxID=7936 RepID=A0A0E9WNV0_ANGAN